MNNLSTTAGTIAGGIDVVSDKIMSGGQERVVGENTKWYMRNKFLQLKHLTKSDKTNEKTLLKILGLSLPITFNNKVFYDDDKKDMPTNSEKKSESEIHKKAIGVLKERLDNSIDIIVKRLVEEYNLRAPLFWVLSDIVKFLAIVNKRKKENARKIKISPSMAAIIEKIWKGKSYFRYVVNTDEVPNNMIELMLHMLEIIEKNKPPKGLWKEPQVDVVKYPCFCKISKVQLEAMINDEKKELKQRIKLRNATGIEVVQEYILTILTIENLLTSHVDNIEKYYIELAKNMSKIFKSLRVFFKKT